MRPSDAGRTYLGADTCTILRQAIAAQIRGFAEELISRLNHDLLKAFKSAELQERLFAGGAEAVGSTPAHFRTFLQKET
jgi:tripartite-type tricarboxylate transporter receptor subunit TctC